MSFRDNVAAEFRRTPLTVLATIGGVIFAGLSLLVAWLQFAGQPAGTAPSASDGLATSNDLILSNLLLAISFFFAASFSAASLIRIIARTHPFPAAALSILAAVLSIFGTLVVLPLAPPKHMTAAAIAAANDSVFYGTVVIFAAINGLPVMRAFATPNFPQDSSSDSQAHRAQAREGAVYFLVILLFLAVWSWLVSAGQSMLVRTFLA